MIKDNIFKFKRDKTNANAELISNAQTVIGATLKRLNIIPAITPNTFITKAKGFKHRYYSLCTNIHNEKFFFRALLINKERSRNMFLKEIAFAKWVSKSRVDAGIFPDYQYWSDPDDEVLWILTKYSNGISLESEIEMELLSIASNIAPVDQICDTLLYVDNLSTDIFIKNGLEVEVQEYEKLLQETRVSLKFFQDKKLLTNDLINGVDNFLKNIETNYEANTFAHGDFHLANIVYDEKDPHVTIIDWENYKFSWPHYDIGFLFTRLWREKNFRKKMIDKYFEKLDKIRHDQFKLFFRLTIVYLSVTQGLTSELLEFSDNEVEMRKKWHLGILKTALVSYDSLMEFHNNN